LRGEDEGRIGSLSISDGSDCDPATEAFHILFQLFSSNCDEKAGDNAPRKRQGELVTVKADERGKNEGE
jgi:hypothetical protein